MTLDDIRLELRTANAVPVAALRAAVAQADAIAPEVYALADKFCCGVYLMPEQEKFLFHGLHVLAAARHADLHPCLVKLLRQREGQLEELFPAYASTSMTRLVLSVWDGDADTLFRMIEHADLGDEARWALIDVLARLTFDGRIERERTAAFLERFESTPFADDEDSIWFAWEDAVTRLGLVALEPALRRVLEKRPHDLQFQQEFDASFAQLHHAHANPTDPAPFVDNNIQAVDDPADALSWITRREEMFQKWALAATVEDGPAPADEDPARDIRLTADEQYWLEGFLVSAHVPDTTLSFEGLDGFLTALVIGPEAVPEAEYLAEIWGADDGAGPSWDSPEQAAYVSALLTKHWTAIAARHRAGGPIAPTMEHGIDDDIRGHMWADGFEVGMAMRGKAWEPLFANRRMSEIVWSLLELAFDVTDEKSVPIAKAERMRLLQHLPTMLQRISEFWKDPLAALPVPQPVRSTKVGRNDPCPCGSGKKYKKCCGGLVTTH